MVIHIRSPSTTVTANYLKATDQGVLSEESFCGLFILKILLNMILFFFFKSSPKDTFIDFREEGRGRKERRKKGGKEGRKEGGRQRERQRER